MLMNVYMYSLVYFIVDLFRAFMRGTQAAIFFQVIAKNQQFYGWAFQRYAFNTTTVVWIFVALLYFIMKPREKINDGMTTKRKDLSAKH